MRFPIVLVALSLMACSTEEPAAPGLTIGTYAGDGRDALCIAGSPGAQRAGFIAYGAKDENCSARGTIAQQNVTWMLTPQGDANCRIPVSVINGRIALGPGTPACAYYCGPGASFAGKSFTQKAADGPVATDFGGDPLC